MEAALATHEAKNNWKKTNIHEDIPNYFWFG